MNSLESELGFNKQNNILSNKEFKTTEQANNLEIGENVEFMSEQAIAQEKSILEKFRGKAKQIAEILLFISALSTTPGMVSKTYAKEIKPTIKTEQIKKEKLASIYSHLQDSQSLLGDKKVVEQILNNDSPFFNKEEPSAKQEMGIKLTGKDRLPWVEQNDKGEQKISIYHTYKFDSAVTEAKEEILTVYIPITDSKDIGKLNVDFSRKYPDSQVRKNNPVIFEDYKLIRPDARKDPDFYKGNTQLLKPEFAVQIKPGSADEYEFVNPAAAEKVNRIIGLHPKFNIISLMTRANERLALQRIREVGEAIGIKEIVDSVNHMLEFDEYNEFFK